jgi:hypothetical protein
VGRKAGSRNSLRHYLIDRDDNVAYKSGRGPFGFKPSELKQSLVVFLQSEKTEAKSPSPKPESRSQTKPTEE